MSRRSKTETVKGHRLPPPRLTAAGWGVLALYVIAPFLGVLLALDGLLYLLFRYGFDASCYGLLCLL